MTPERIFAVKVDAVVRFILATLILAICAIGLVEVCFAGPAAYPGIPPAIGNGAQVGPGFAPMQRGSVIAGRVIPSLEGRAGVDNLVAYWYYDNFISPAAGQGPAYWTDLIGGLVASFPSDTYKPTLATAGVKFPVGADAMNTSYLNTGGASLTGFPTGSSPRTIFVRSMKHTAGGVINTVFRMGGTAKSNAMLIACYDVYTSGKMAYGYASAPAFYQNYGSVIPVGEYQTQAITYSSDGKIGLWQNGNSLYSQVVNMNTQFDPYGVVIGASLFSAQPETYGCYSTIREVAIFNRELTAAELATWESVQ